MSCPQLFIKPVWVCVLKQITFICNYFSLKFIKCDFWLNAWPPPHAKGQQMKTGYFGLNWHTYNSNINV